MNAGHSLPSVIATDSSGLCVSCSGAAGSFDLWAGLRKRGRRIQSVGCRITEKSLNRWGMHGPHVQCKGFKGGDLFGLFFRTSGGFIEGGRRGIHEGRGQLGRVVQVRSALNSTGRDALRLFSSAEVREQTERLLSVKRNAGRSKGVRGRDSGGRIEGPRRNWTDRRKEGAPSGNPNKHMKNPGVPGPDKKGGTDENGIRLEGTRQGETGGEKVNTGGNTLGDRGGGKPKKGPKPRDLVTRAGMDFMLVNRGDRRLGTEWTPWTSDPAERQPDEYYEHGPYGPHAWKGLVVGRPRKGTMADKLVVFFSSVKNEEEQKQINILDAKGVYNNRLMQLDESVGIQYFLVFVRQTRRIGLQIPWREWTLVAQVAVESGAELDKWRLGFYLDRQTRDNLTRFVAWYRPDLIFVKKPGYQVRFEPQKEFLEKLVELLNPENDGSCTPVAPTWDGRGVGKSNDSYFGRMCRTLGVGERDSAEEVGSKFESLDEEGRLQCLEHVLGTHPVQLLTPFTRRAREEDRMTVEESVGSCWQEEEGNWEEPYESDDSLNNNSQAEVEGWEDGESDDFEQEGVEDDGDWEGDGWEGEEGKAILTEGELQRANDDDAYWNQKMVKAYSEIEDSEVVDESEEQIQTQKSELFLKAALCPYTYTSLIKEIVIIRHTLVDYPALR